MTPHELLGILAPILAAQVGSYLALREHVAALKAEFHEFKESTNRQVDSVERRVAALEHGG